MAPSPAIAGIALLLLPGLTAAESVRVRVGERIERVALERYVESAVASEVYADWPAEALKAQAVVARTYAVYERARRAGESYDLDASVLSQRYGAERPGSAVRSAVAETRGEHLTYQGEPILAAFHAAAGGRTASAEEVWGRRVPYLRSVSSPDAASPDHYWAWEIAEADLIEALREAGLPVRSAQIGGIERSRSGRVAALTLGGVRLSGRDLRKILGGRAIRSALFQVIPIDAGLRFVGSGAGHGVGLSQWGARELALHQQDYREILQHYYPGTALVTLRRGPALVGGTSE